MPVKCADKPLSGLWQPQPGLKHLHYGPSCVKSHLLSVLPQPNSKVFVVTGSSIATKTPILKLVQDILGPSHLAGTFASVRQHGPIADVDAATELVLANPDIDTILSIGGGSPIDTAKTISWRVAQESSGAGSSSTSATPKTPAKWLFHIAIPTTLSAAECTAGGGYTNLDGVKIGFMAPEMAVSAIFYDPECSRYTPRDLWLSTGMRALDHAVECMYHPFASEMPWKGLAIYAAEVLVQGLTECSRSTAGPDTLTRLMLAAYASSGLKGTNFYGGMGLSHSLGHALGSPYGIPHGITSCMTLSKVVALKARRSRGDAAQIARLLPGMGGIRTGDDVEDALEVAAKIAALVRGMNLPAMSLTERRVGKEQVNIIVKRASKGLDDETVKEVEKLVITLF